MIAVELNSPCGPRVEYPVGADADEIEAAVPDGWEVDWQTVPAHDEARRVKWSPLVRVTEVGR